MGGQPCGPLVVYKPGNTKVSDLITTANHTPPHTHTFSFFPFPPHQKHISDHLSVSKIKRKTYSEPFASLLPHYHQGMPSISVMVCEHVHHKTVIFYLKALFPCINGKAWLNVYDCIK